MKGVPERAQRSGSFGEIKKNIMDMIQEVNGIMLEAIETVGAEGDRFVISDDGKAEWAMGKIRAAQAEQSRMSAHYKTQMEAINRRASETIDFFTNMLADYFDHVPKNTTKTGIEKYKLPSGELLRKPASIDYQRDEDALLAWCKESHPEYVKTVEKAAWAEVKKLITSTGEIPGGVVPIETPAKFEVKVGEEV